MENIDHDVFLFFVFVLFASGSGSADKHKLVLVDAFARCLYHTQRHALRAAFTPVSGVSIGISCSVCGSIQN